MGFIANVPLNYMLIFGAWGAPELGAEGCGLATAASMWISTLIILLYVLRRAPCSLTCHRWLRGLIGDVSVKSSWWAPVGLTFFLGDGCLFRHHATDRDTRRRGGCGASNRHQCLGRFLHSNVSIGSAMATRMGHAIGARNAHGVRMALRVGAALSTLIGLLAMSLLLLFPDAIIGAYTQSEDIRISRSGYCDWRRCSS
ncbi:MAG: hypothetical protein CM15mP89_0190 [Gammaproteobacteria bacterium]|nr:MAG: hypothetical protein CM15mP89_0190 [Gammaproteobacteria bacterium]